MFVPTWLGDSNYTWNSIYRIVLVSMYKYDMSMQWGSLVEAATRSLPVQVEARLFRHHFI